MPLRLNLTLVYLRVSPDCPQIVTGGRQRPGEPGLARPRCPGSLAKFCFVWWAISLGTPQLWPSFQESHSRPEPATLPKSSTPRTSRRCRPAGLEKPPHSFKSHMTAVSGEGLDFRHRFPFTQQRTQRCDINERTHERPRRSENWIILVAGITQFPPQNRERAMRPRLSLYFSHVLGVI